jgi:hypothetical protein
MVHGHDANPNQLLNIFSERQSTLSMNYKFHIDEYLPNILGDSCAMGQFPTSDFNVKPNSVSSGTS